MLPLEEIKKLAKDRVNASILFPEPADYLFAENNLLEGYMLRLKEEVKELQKELKELQKN